MKKTSIAFKIDNIMDCPSFTADFYGSKVTLSLPRAVYTPVNHLFSAICNLTPNGFRFKDVRTDYKYGISGRIVNGVPEFDVISDCLDAHESFIDEESSVSSFPGPNYIPLPSRSYVFWGSTATQDYKNSGVSWILEKNPKDIFNFAVKITIKDKQKGIINNFTVNYCDLCYAAGKLGTDVFKSLGIKGFKYVFPNNSLDFEKIILLKEYALHTSKEDMKMQYTENGLPFPDYKADLALLVKDL